MARGLRAVVVVVFALAAFLAPSLFAPPKPVLTSARITRIVAVPGEPAHVVIVRGRDGRIGGATIDANRLTCAIGERVPAVVRDERLLPDPSRCLRQTRTRSRR